MESISGRCSEHGVLAIDYARMMKFTTTATFLLSATILFVGCSKNAIKSPPLGFLSQPDLMKQQGDGTWQYTAATIDWSKYTSVFVAPVAIADDAYDAGVYGSVEDLPGLAATFQSDLQTALTKKFAAATNAGPNTLVVKAQITKADPNATALNIAPQSQIMGRGYGYGQVAIEIVDGGTGALLYEFAGVQNTSRFSAEKMSVWGSLEKSFKDWSSQIAKFCGIS